MAYFSHGQPRRELVVGYHGTSTSAAYTIIAKGFEPSTGLNEWLGHGVYFWSKVDAAWLWGERCHKRCAVVEASLVLGYCLDLDNPDPLTDFLRDVGAELDVDLLNDGRSLPSSTGDEQMYNCELLNRAAVSTYPITDSIIRTFSAGPAIVKRSDLRAATRLQICVRNLDHILNPVLHTERP